MKQALAANRSRIWMFGQSWDFHLVTSTTVLNADNYSNASHQKSQIVLHGTAGNGTAEQTIAWWNHPDSSAASAHFVVERTHVAQVARPGGGGSDRSDAGLVDVVRVLDEDLTAYHGGNVNATSIGIEISNAAWSWFGVSVATEPSLAGGHAVAACLAPINIGSALNPHWVCNHARPTDTNRFIHLVPGIGGQDDYQSVLDEQYTALILLLRHLCISHRIPRTFLGTSRAEVFRHYETEGTAVEKRVQKSTLFHFHGIFAHRNAHPDKVCPGIVNRNRLYRGILDEWWLPVQRDGTPRAYYSGPFAEPAYPAGGPSRNSHFRFTAAGRIEGTVYRDANLDALIETQSYYDLDQVNAYYADTETRMGGMFPVGVNKVWHGGVHLTVQDTNPCVFAAASGAIVAARVSNNDETERHPLFGSQRFVLIKHAVYRETQADPGGLGQRINYGANSVIVFSLYMHLAAFRDLARENDENPPWFNIWRRNHPGADVGMDGEKGRVFFPNIDVSVGDILGMAGTFRRRRLIHFEIISHRNTELAGAPWDDRQRRFEDTDANFVCNVPALDRYLRDRVGDGIDVVDVLRAAPDLRMVKAMHKSEWALSSEAQIEPLVPHPDRRAVMWPHFRRFTWVAEAAAGSPAIQRYLGDATGMFWHYHPITFMHHINTLIIGENREIRESEDQRTNVELDEDGYLTNFVGWQAAPAPGHFAPAAADNNVVHPALVASGAQAYRFSRRDISCFQAGAHVPGLTPPRATKFSLALLEVLERVRSHFNASITVTLSFVCDNHVASNALCVLNNAAAVNNHHQGNAVDIRPSAQNPVNCRNLWNSVRTILATLNPQMAHLCGTPTQASFPSGYEGVAQITSPPAVEAKLRAIPQQALTAAEANAFRIHLELTPAAAAAAAADTSDLPVRLRIVVSTVTVLDDQDTFGAGEWNLQASVNGELLGSLVRDVNTGDVIPVNWTKEVTVPPNGAVRLSVSGFDEDVFFNDSLGSFNATYNRGTSPPWGIGQWSGASSNNSFRITFGIESLNTQE